MKAELVPELSKSQFEKFTKDGLVLIDFFTEWCMPCLMMEPIIEEISEKFKGKIKFGKVNIEDHSDLAQKFNIRSIPNFILFKDGKIAENFIGSMAAEEFDERLREFV